MSINPATRYKNSILGDLLAIMEPEEILEFGVEIAWLKDCVGDREFKLVLHELGNLSHMTWQSGLRVALQTVIPGARIDVECPQPKN